MHTYTEFWAIMPAEHAAALSHAACRVLDVCDVVVEGACKLTDGDLDNSLLCAALVKTYSDIGCLLYSGYAVVVESRGVILDDALRLLFLLLRAAPQPLFYWPLR